jgi:HSP20 family molecular chaperone IbpA
MFPWNFFPFSKEAQSKLQKMNPEEMNQYIQKMINNIFQSSTNTNPLQPEEFMKGFHPFQSNTDQPSSVQDSSLDYSVYETHNFIFVRIQLESEEWLKQMKLYHTAHLLILEHIPEYGNKHSIQLPSLVKKKGTTANYKDGMLEVQIPKNIDFQYSEIDITEIL